MRQTISSLSRKYQGYTQYNNELLRLIAYLTREPDLSGASKSLPRFDPILASLFTTSNTPFVPLKFDDDAISNRIKAIKNTENTSLPTTFNLYHSLNTETFKLILNDKLRLTGSQRAALGLSDTNIERLRKLSFSQLEHFIAADKLLITLDLDCPELLEKLTRCKEKTDSLMLLVTGRAGFQLINSLYGLDRPTFRRLTEYAKIEKLKPGRSTNLSRGECRSFLSAWTSANGLPFEQRIYSVSNRTGITIQRCWKWMVANSHIVKTLDSPLQQQTHLVPADLSEQQTRTIMELWTHGNIPAKIQHRAA